MFARLRQAFWIILALVAGFAAGNGPLAEWAIDTYHMLGVDWAAARLARGPNGTFPLLLAGFLLGQGIYLLLRRSISRIGPQRARNAERLAAWDPSLQIAKRFGMYRYLEHCSQWAAEDPTTRTQSLALFKICGIGALNDEMGSLVATQLLQRIAVELRLASLPDSASRFEHWLVKYLPRPAMPNFRGLPFPRYPARWSGSTFALAFRELDAVQAISVTRDLAAWIRSELASIRSSGDLSLSAVIAVGNANVTARSLAAAGVESVLAGNGSQVTVVHDNADLRSEAFAQMKEVAHRSIAMSREEPQANAAATETPDFGAKTVAWLRVWGPAFGCIASTAILLGLTGGKSSMAPTIYTWPDNVSEIQMVDATGSKTVRIMRNTMQPLSLGGWSLTGAKIAQGNPADGQLVYCQIYLSITNSTDHTYYVSSYDLFAVDAKGRRIAMDPSRNLRLAQGLTGSWLSPGEALTGWLQFPQGDALITALEFKPDRFTDLVLHVEN